MVFNRRTGGDQVQPIAGHVGDDERNQPSRAARSGESSAFDQAELLADRIELLDVRAGRAEMPRDGELVLQRGSFHGGRQQGRAAAGEQAEAQVFRRERADQPQDCGCAGRAGGSRFVHARRPGRVQADPFQRAYAIGRHIDPARELLLFRQPRPEDFFHGGGHACACLAGADDDNPPQAAQGDLFVPDHQQRSFEVQGAADKPIGADGREPGVPDGKGIGKQGGRRKAEGGGQGRLHFMPSLPRSRFPRPSG